MVPTVYITFFEHIIMVYKLYNEDKVHLNMNTNIQPDMQFESDDKC